MIGQEFLNSDFITNQELPSLDAAIRRGTRLYPVVTGYCLYEMSDLRISKPTMTSHVRLRRCHVTNRTLF